MTGVPDHAKPAHRDRLLPVLVLIVACGLLEVWASWLTIGAVSGFPKLGRMTTGWILPVTAEAYWSAALYAWLVGPSGPRSRRFAMWTAVIMFALSLTGQEAGHLAAAAHRSVPPLLTGFVTALPLTAIGLGAILIHLRHADREEAEHAARRATEADERTALQAELDRAQEALAAAETARYTAACEAAEAAAVTEQMRAQQAETEAASAAQQTALDAAHKELEIAQNARAEAERARANADARTAQLQRKLDAQAPAQGARKPGAGKNASTPRSARTEASENEVDARTEALRILSEEPDISGAKLGLAAGMSKRWGQDHRAELAAMAAEFADGESGEMAAEDAKGSPDEQ